MNESHDTKVGRREFVGLAAAATAGFTILKPSTVFGTQANSAVRLGVLGCGGRGTAVTESFLREHGRDRDGHGRHLPGQHGEERPDTGRALAEAQQAFRRCRAHVQGLQGLRTVVREQGRRRRLHRDAALFPSGSPRGRHRRRQARLPGEAGGGRRAGRQADHGPRREDEGQAEPGRRLPDPLRVAVRAAREAHPRRHRSARWCRARSITSRRTSTARRSPTSRPTSGVSGTGSTRRRFPATSSSSRTSTSST